MRLPRPRTLVLVGSVLAGSWLWSYTRPVWSSPYDWVRAVGAGVNLHRARLYPAEQQDYSYSFDPLQRYLSYEAQFVPVDSPRILQIADRIAQETALRMLLETSVDDVREAEERIWERGDARKIMLWIAEGLREARIIYAQESLLSRAFDPEQHTSDIFHLDCDLIGHFFLHVANRLDLDVREMKSPLHAYLVYRAPGLFRPVTLSQQIFVEPTQFRSIVRSGRFVDYMGQGPGDDFFIPPDYHRNGQGGVWASPELIERVGYYEPMTDRALDDSIAINVLHGVEELAQRERRPELSERVRTELEARLEGTRDPTLVSNLYALYIAGATRAAETGQAERALQDARRAERLRTQWGDLLIRREPHDQVLVARALQLMDQREESRTIIEALHRWYASHARRHQENRALSDAHAELFLLDALSREQLGPREYEQLLVPIIDFERSLQARSGDRQPSPRLTEAYALSAAALRESDPDQAREYRELSQQ